jgi:hypothetical protein
LERSHSTPTVSCSQCVTSLVESIVKRETAKPEFEFKGNCLQIGNESYRLKDKVEAKEGTLMLARRTMQTEPNKVPNEGFPLLHQSHLFNLDTLYILDLTGQHSVFEKSIHLSEVEDVFAATADIDFLPNYNVAIKTKTQLVLVSTRSATEAVRMIDSLKAQVPLYHLLKSKGLLCTFANPGSLMQQLESFDAERFMEAVHKDVLPQSDRLDPTALSQSLKSMRKYLGLLHKNKISDKQKQQFVKCFHARVVGRLESCIKQVEQWKSARVLVFLRKCSKLLASHGVVDEGLTRLEVHLTQLNHRRSTEAIRGKVEERVREYFDENGPKKDYSKNYFAEALDVLHEEFTRPGAGKLTAGILDQTLSDFNQHTKALLFQRKTTQPSCLIHLLNSACKFNREFFGFVDRFKAKECNVDFLNDVGRSRVASSVAEVTQVFFREVSVMVEAPVFKFFSEHKSFESLDLVVLLSKRYQDLLQKTKRHLLQCLSETILNNALNATLRLYFLTLLMSFAGSTDEIHFEKKLERDRNIVSKFFSGLIEPANLSPQTETFTQLLSLLTETHFDKLLQATIKFDLFFDNQLQFDTISAIFEKNIYVSFEVEREVLSLFSDSSQMKEKQFATNRPSGKRQSASGKTAKAKRSVCNYMPSVTVGLFTRAKAEAFNAKLRVTIQDLKDDIDLSLGLESRPVKRSGLALQSFIKVVVVVESETASEFLLSVHLQAHNYFKLEAVLREDCVVLMDFDSQAEVFRLELSEVQSVHKRLDVGLSLVG